MDTRSVIKQILSEWYPNQTVDLETPWRDRPEFQRDGRQPESLSTRILGEVLLEQRAERRKQDQNDAA